MGACFSMPIRPSVNPGPLSSTPSIWSRRRGNSWDEPDPDPLGTRCVSSVNGPNSQAMGT
jgi:hypothetical protein